MSNNPWEKSPAEVAAERLLQRHWDFRIPVDVTAIAERQGVTVLADAGLAVERLSGQVCLEESGPVIRYNPEEPAVRQRFTIAHELGHLVLGHLRTGTCYRDSLPNYDLHVTDYRERDANIFAAHLLMPPAAVRAAIDRLKEPRLEALARLFGVSRTAMEIRLKSMGIVPEWM